MRATIVKQHSSFDFYGKFFTIYFFLTKIFKKIRILTFFFDLKNQTLTYKHSLSERGIGSCLDFLYPNCKKKIIFLLFDWKILPVRYDQFLFLARSATRPSEKRLQAFFSATPAATPSVICVACTMPRTFFMFSN